ncbi:MAG: dihydrofolate reductase, partial [Cellulomonadaceae bacterium]
MSTPGRPAGSWLGMIWAQDEVRGIGRDGALPWHLPEDLAHFKATTLGVPVIMGRLQWESLPEQVRPLPGRRNIVLTRNPGYRAEGAEVVTSLPAALAAVAGQRAWVIGGGQVYRLALPHADEIVLTEVEGTHGADVHAPTL